MWSFTFNFGCKGYVFKKPLSNYLAEEMDLHRGDSFDELYLFISCTYSRQIYMQAPVDGWNCNSQKLYGLYYFPGQAQPLRENSTVRIKLRGLQFQAATGAACIFVLYQSSIHFEDLKQRRKRHGTYLLTLRVYSLFLLCFLQPEKKQVLKCTTSTDDIIATRKKTTVHKST